MFSSLHLLHFLHLYFNTKPSDKATNINVQQIREKTVIDLSKLNEIDKENEILIWKIYLKRISEEKSTNGEFVAVRPEIYIGDYANSDLPEYDYGTFRTYSSNEKGEVSGVIFGGEDGINYSPVHLYTKHHIPDINIEYIEDKKAFSSLYFNNIEMKAKEVQDTLRLISGDNIQFTLENNEIKISATEYSIEYDDEGKAFQLLKNEIPTGASIPLGDKNQNAFSVIKVDEGIFEATQPKSTLQIQGANGIEVCVLDGSENDPITLELSLLSGEDGQFLRYVKDTPQWVTIKNAEDQNF